MRTKMRPKDVVGLSIRTNATKGTVSKRRKTYYNKVLENTFGPVSRSIFFLKNGPNPASFCLFSFFSHAKYSINLTINYKSIDGVLGTRPQGSRIVGTDEFTELWRPPKRSKFYHMVIFILSCCHKQIEE